MSNDEVEVKIVKKRNPRNNQKLKIMYLMKILLEDTDETHSITMQEIIDKLAAYDVTAERKSLYTDFEQLRLYGLDVIGEQHDRNYYYKIGNRQFELAELKLLVDSVQSAKFITTRKSNELIRKIEKMASRYEASKLQRQVIVAGRVKTMNESIYYNVDYIHTAISENVKIKFKYFDWDVNKKMVPRHEDKTYIVSPFSLLWDDENYYLVAFDDVDQKIKHYRVDKMMKLSLTEVPREGKKHFNGFNVAEYAKKHFGMFDGEEASVSILCENRLAGVMIDRFGKDVKMYKVDDEHFKVIVDVAVSRHFLGWIIALGTGAKIIGPENVVDTMKDEVRRLMGQYDM